MTIRMVPARSAARPALVVRKRALPLQPASATRTRILAAAATEFAARGFAGAGVERIARQARVNKAMIYYHFKSKAALYREVLRDMFRATGDRVRAIAAEPGPAQHKLEAFVAAVAGEAERRPHFPPIMLRELAEKGRHLDSETLRLLAIVPQSFTSILKGVAKPGSLGATEPILSYFTLMGPMMLYLSSGPVRNAMARRGIASLSVPALDGFVRYMQEMATVIATSSARTLRKERS